MAFKRRRKVYKLDFEGTEYDGLEVKVRGLTTGEYLEIISLSAPGVESGDKETEGILAMLATHLVSWNLVDEDEVPVPTTFEGVKANDLTMNLSIVNAWTDAIANVPEKTEKKSLPGESPLVSSIPMETL